MLYPLWRVVEGPEWQESVDAANPYDAYYEFNIETIRLALQLNPYSDSTAPFLDGQDDARVFETNDAAGGYRVAAFYFVDRESHSVELRWMAIFDDD